LNPEPRLGHRHGIFQQGHIHTRRADVPDFPGAVVRQDSKLAIAEKLGYMRWLREQIEAGFQENLPLHVIEASCFPRGGRSSWVPRTSA